MAGVESMVVGWFAWPVVKSVAEKAEKYLCGNYKLHKDRQEMVETLTRTLLLCLPTVKEAEERMINNPDLAAWLKKLKEAAYDAEDVLDDMEAQSIKDQDQGIKSKVSKIASSSLKLVIPDDNVKRLKKVVDKLTDISDEIPKFAESVRMKENSGSINNKLLKDQRETISLPLERVELYGRQKELESILELVSGAELRSSQKKLGPNYNNYHGILVIPIVGMGGVGKTALAQAVFNHPEVQKSFETKAWTSVSNSPDIKLLMHLLVEIFSKSENQDVQTLEEIARELSLLINGKRFLVVLDDMLFENQWDELYSILSRGAPGSVVLITTQNQPFANRVATIRPILLYPLEPEIFWELFRNFVFQDKVIPEENKNWLEQIGKQIAEKLHGLPLAAKIIGNILRCNINEDTWRRISRSDWWSIDEGRSIILPSISIGYQNLDPCLQQCFAYCALFPRNSLIDKDSLLQMWIAHSFVPHDISGSRKIEDIGREWFDKLVEMSFFQPAGDNKGYVIPSLMHDLAIIVSSHECFCLTDQSHEIPQSVRHLAVHTKNPELVKMIIRNKKLLSFLYFGSSHVDEMYSAINMTLCELDRIRVLDLSNLHMGTKNPPPAIQNMTHLRFLNLSSTGIKVLTHSRFDHYHLQSLHIRECSSIQLPRGINKLINLRHFNADAETIAQISSVGQLVNLQELHEYRVRKEEGYKITELKNLRELTGHLRIIDCQNIESKEEAEQARLFDKQNLHSVELCWSSACLREPNNDMEILEGLKPYKDINELTIEGYMGSLFPDWMSEMSHFLNLQTVRLHSCSNIEVLPPLGQPPFLSSLEIIESERLREATVHCFSASLKSLKIVDCHKFNSFAESLPHLTSLSLLHVVHCEVSIALNINALRLLEDLMLSGCPELSIDGDMQSLTNLKRLQITRCPKILSFRLHDIMRKQKGKGSEAHEVEGLLSLSYLEMDESLLHSDYHLILGRLPSLRFLHCIGSEQSQFTEDQTHWFQELTALQELTFTSCKFNQLPSTLAKLSTLTKVTLKDCDNLESLPADGMPPFLQDLSLSGCSQNLVRHCQPKEGKDWQLISHVHLIQIDGKAIDTPQSSTGTSG